MLEYHRIDISEGIDINKTNASKKRGISDYCYFFDKIFNFIFNGCHDQMQKAMNLMMLLLSLLKGMIIEFIFGI